MTATRALLEAAARAGGYPATLPGWKWHPDDPKGFEYQKGDRLLIWNSAADDGDAMRLAVKLRLDMCVTPDEKGMAVWCVPISDFVEEAFVGDEMAATRLAITRAAAQMDPEKT